MLRKVIAVYCNDGDDYDNNDTKFINTFYGEFFPMALQPIFESFPSLY